MSEKHISEELWMRFLEGNVTEEENEQLMRLIAEEDELLEEYIAVNESMKRIDSQPFMTPNIEKAEQQIHEVMGDFKTEKIPVPTIPLRSRVRRIWAAAAVAAVLIGVALFFLFRPERSDNNFAQQDEKRIEQEAKTQNQSSETTIEKVNSDSEDDHSTSKETLQETYTTQKLEKNYATTQEANNLTVAKPNKDNYRVLCKNLEKTFNFEWSATNVQTLHFVVKDSKGKTVAETQDVTANQYLLKYADIHPEQKITWSLDVTFKDGAQEKRNGQVQIDYNN